MKNNAYSSRVECAKTIEDLLQSDSRLIHITSDGNDHTKDNPDRCFDVGIAESNLINVATGFALKSHVVIVNAISSFMLYNALLQIRNNLCYHKLPVVMLGVGSGFSYGHLGFSHHTLEDISVLRSLPNMRLYLPADANEASLALHSAVKNDGPSYIRIGAGLEPDITSTLANQNFNAPYEIRTGTDVLLFTYGSVIIESIEAADILAKRGISVSIINVNSLYVYDPHLLLSSYTNQKLIVTIEEHYVDCGVGSVINSLFTDKLKIPVINMGVPKEFVPFGATSHELKKYYGLDSQGIAEKIFSLINDRRK